MLNPDRTVADLVLEHPACARVLQRHRIDFCCRGERPLEQACRERRLDVDSVLAELEHAIADDDPGLDLRSLPTLTLIEYIVQRHHGYLREALPFVCGLAAKVARVHGDKNESLRELKDIVDELRDALEPHLQQEESTLFPALLAEPPNAAELGRQLGEMMTEHEEVGALLWRMRAAADDYRFPDWACRSYRALFTELANLEADVLRHVHAENYVLRPRYQEADAAAR